ncbi:MAG: T9SS type A sorting domain-containing protein [Ferruginibacter sp.]
MRKIYLLLFAVVLFAAAKVNAQVTVTATGAGPGPTVYATLKLAFDAVNLGTHTGAITCTITASTTEGTTPATLNSSGAGSASYTSLLIQPSVDGLSISGNPAGGFGVIQLKGSDNVTIDGDNPNTGGTNRNLSIINTAVNTVTYNSAIRITTVNVAAALDANNNTIKNCILTGSASGRNASANTSTTGSENTTFGILVGYNGGTTAIDAPIAHASVTGALVASTTVNNLIVDNNAINSCARGVAFIGGTSSSSTGITISNNLIGDQATTLSGLPPYTTPTTTVYTKGIYIQGTNAYTVTGNTIKNILSYVGTTMNAIEVANTGLGSGAAVFNSNTLNGIVNNGTSAANGILLSGTGWNSLNVNSNTVTNIQTVGTASASGINISGAPSAGIVLMDKNSISTIYARNAGGYAANGITIASGSMTVQNNMVWDMNAVGNNSTTGTTFGVRGIRLSGGTNHKIYHNTVSLGGAMLAGGTGVDVTAAFTITATTITGVDVRNNIFSNTMTGASAKHACVQIPTGATSAMNLLINNNAYYGSATVNLGMTSTTLVEYSIANFNAGATSPATNWRSYSSTLLAANTNNDNASLAFTTAAPFVSSTDLHISTGVTPTQLESGGASVGILTDIDGQVRPGPTGSVNGGATAPDLGADEFDGVPLDLTAPSISYTPLTFTCLTTARTLTTSITDASGVPTSGFGLPVLYWKINAGAYSAVTAVYVSGSTYNFTFGAGVAAGDIVSYYIVAQDNAATPNIIASPSAGAGGYTANPPAASTPPTSPNTYTISSSLGGNYNVGAAGTYLTLTAAIAAYNSSCLTSAVTFSLIDAAYTEAAAMSINANPDASAVNTLTIKPTLANTTIAVTSGSTGAIITLNGADYVTINGSISATANTVCPAVSAPRDLTITNTNAGTSSAVVWLQTNVADAATNNKVINCNLVGNSNITTLFGVGSGSSTIGTTSLGTGNNNNQFVNNNISKTQYGIYSQGAALANKNSGTVINQNLINTATPNNVQFNAIWVGFENGVQISANNISGLTTTNDLTAITAGLTPTAISTTATTGNEVTGATITNNVIGTVVSTSTTGFSAAGIAIASAATGTNLIANNVIYGVTAPSTSGDLATGIYVGGGAATTQVYYNSVSMSGTRGSATYSSFALAVNGTTPTIDIRNNILVNTQTSTGAGQSYAIGLAYTSTVGNYANLTSNYNDFYTSGTSAALSKVGSLSQGSGTNLTTLAAWQAETGRDANSISADPLFNSITNLQPQTGSPVVGAAITGTGITTDITCFTRSGTTPTIGAYETAADLTAPVITYTLLNNTLCLNDRTLLPVTITDAGSGVNIAAGTRPRLYFKKSTNANTFLDNTSGTDGWKYVEATGVAGSPFSFTTNYLLINGGVAIGNIIQYFVVAQDLAATPNVAINSGVFNATPTSVALTVAAFPITGTIYQYTLLGGLATDVTIGAGGTYPTLTGTGGLFETINNGGLLNNITARIISATITEDGTNSLNAVNYGCVGSYTLHIKPDVGITTVLSGTGAPVLINLNGADNVTFDGSNNGTSTKDMTIRNLSTTGATIRFINDATYNTVKNTIIEGAVTGTTNGVILFSTSTGTLGNSNNAITNNDIRERTDVTAVFANAIYSSGTALVPNATNTVSGNKIFNFNSSGINLASTGLGNNWQLINNNIYNAQATPSAVTQNGILITAGTGHTISGNFVGGNAAGASGTWTNTGNVVVMGISLTGGIANISNNTISNINNTGTGTTARVRGIHHTSANDGVVISNNQISNLSCTGAVTGVAANNQVAVGINIFPGSTFYNTTISGNIIENISAENTSALTTYNMAAGVFLTNFTGDFTKNIIRNIKNKGTGTTAGQPPLAVGIYARFMGTGNVVNNMISLGSTENTNTQFAGVMITGISAAGNTHRYYYNSISVSGTSSGNIPSYGFVRGEDTTTTAIQTMDLQNNILSITRTGVGASNYAIATKGPFAGSNWSSNYNDLYSSDPLNIGYWNATGYDFANWKTTSGGDANSVSVLPNFVSTTDLHLVPATNCRLDGYGIPIAGITTDYDNQARDAGAPDMGADEFATSPVSTTLASANACDTKNVSPAGTIFINTSCSLIARLLPSGGTAVSGQVKACATIDGVQMYFNLAPYVQRHIDIEPAINASASTGTVTLYFTDGEFSTYNSNNPTYPPLPTFAGGGSADPNRTNLKVTQYHGTPTSTPSAPGFYTGTAVLIDPADGNIVWNGNFWEVSFNVNGFSGFYVHTSLIGGPLPITINYFNGSKQGSNHLLNWKVTCNSTPRATMILERSADSRNFNAIHTVTADAARCNQPFDYTDAQPLAGMNYYRLKMVDVDGKISYSGIVALLNAVKGFDIISIAPNPVVTNNFKLNVSNAQASKMDITIVDMQGRIVNRQTVAVIAGFNSISMNAGNLAAGTYTIQCNIADDKSRVIRFVKQ